MKSILSEEGYPLALMPTYLAWIEGSVGSRQYRKCFVDRRSGPFDVIGDGDLACALYVSAILKLFNLTQGGVHTTVTETVLDLTDSGCPQIDDVRPGAIIVWGKKLCTDGLHHRHIGFSLGGDRAVSTCPKVRTPIEHHFTYGEVDGRPVRPIEAIFFPDILLVHV